MSPRSKAPPAEDALPDGEPTSIVRRAPFANSPFVGERGQKAQIRILEAALEVFGEVGYHGCGIKRITELSGYSRASFYQYFSSKEDLFRHLAGRVARELAESGAALGPITPDAAGWESIHGWLSRYAVIYDTYEAVFVTFQTAVRSDAMVASGASVVADHTFTDLRSRIAGSELRPAQIDSVVRMLLHNVGRLYRDAEMLDLAGPAVSLDRERAVVAFADAFHRALFGPDPAINVHTSTRRLKPSVASDPFAAHADRDGDPAHGPAAQRTRTQLLAAGHEVFIERGYYATRVADIVKAAGVSHGVFYRYFENKTHLFRILAEEASVGLNEALTSLPSPFVAGAETAPDELRGWLRRYADSHAANAAIFAMWTEAISRDEELAQASAALIDGSRSQLARYLEPRGWGDFEADALVLLVFLDAMTAQPATAARVEASAQMIERGLLTGPPVAAVTTAASRRATKAAKAAPKTTKTTKTTRNPKPTRNAKATTPASPAAKPVKKAAKAAPKR